MKRLFRKLGFIISLLLGLVILFVALIFCIFLWGNYTMKKELVYYQKEVCDSIKIIKEEIDFRVVNFKPNEVKFIEFYLIRYGKLHKTSSRFLEKELLDDEQIILPFNFQRLDTIVVLVGNRYYLLSGFDYEARYQHYGMTGPIGDCECQFTGIKKMNNKIPNYQPIYLYKEDGITNYILPENENIGNK
ncbi:hypothetical protein KO02_00275 [Sphingobacterium sp. ML3W]|uniref:hypothetical protein n=1 Tax=Sphingobacterium sp. ML3W TaxID=1538644 RepID=UPI0004F7A247|nr:hypothetical protein [Sphingobacterium sp. ML3W]AIM35273.1 hypothetical protein KO02_00275 [Sphingobacterium sp. ML3W]